MQASNLPFQFDRERYLSDPRYQESIIQCHPEQLNILDTIKDFVERVRKCETYEDYYVLQNDLGQFIEHIDKQVGMARRRRESAKNRQRRIKSRKNGFDENEVAQEEFNETIADYEHAVYKRMSKQARYIGDAMAWQLYECDTRIIRALGLNNSHGPIPNPEGVGPTTEKEMVEQLWKENGAFALRHDYTNCLRVSDLSIFSLHEKNIARIVEIKTNEEHTSSNQKKISRRSYQLAKESIAELKDGSIVIQHLQKELGVEYDIEKNLSLLNIPLQQAGADGVGFSSNDYLEVLAYNIKKITEPGVSTKIVEYNRGEEPLVIPKARRTSEGVMIVSSLIKVLHSQFGVPYTLFHMPPDYVAGLIVGILRVEIKLNTEALADGLRKCGLAVYNAFMEEENTEPSIFIKIGDDPLKIDWQALEKIIFECLPIEVLAASIKASYNLHKEVLEENKKQGISTSIDCIIPDYAEFWRASRHYTRT